MLKTWLIILSFISLIILSSSVSAVCTGYCFNESGNTATTGYNTANGWVKVGSTVQISTAIKYEGTGSINFTKVGSNTYIWTPVNMTTSNVTLAYYIYYDTLPTAAGQTRAGFLVGNVTGATNQPYIVTKGATSTTNFDDGSYTAAHDSGKAITTGVWLRMMFYFPGNGSVRRYINSTTVYYETNEGINYPVTANPGTQGGSGEAGNFYIDQILEWSGKPSDEPVPAVASVSSANLTSPLNDTFYYGMTFNVSGNCSVNIASTLNASVFINGTYAGSVAKTGVTMLDFSLLPSYVPVNFTQVPIKVNCSVGGSSVLSNNMSVYFANSNGPKITNIQSLTALGSCAATQSGWNAFILPNTN